MTYSARPPRTALERCIVLEWMRNMFERGRDIREAKKAEILAKARRKGWEEGYAEGYAEGYKEGYAEGYAEERRKGWAVDRAGGIKLIREREKEMRTLLESRGVVLPPEVADAIFGDAAGNGS